MRQQVAAVAAVAAQEVESPANVCCVSQHVIHGLCHTCHVVNDCFEARAAVLWVQHRLKEGQAVDLHLGTACQVAQPAWCCKLSFSEQPHHVEVEDLHAKLNMLQNSRRHMLRMSQCVCNKLDCANTTAHVLLL